MKPTLLFAALATVLAAAAPRAHADDKIACDPAAKKLEWHVCVVGPVDYKRGMKTETRDECAIDKIVKPAGGCDFGDLTKYIPEGADVASTRFYAIGPDSFTADGFEAQGEPGYGYCSLNSSHGVDAWQLMKFSDAFDKSNRERSELVVAGLKKKKKAILSMGVSFSLDPQGCTDKAAKLGVLDTKTLSKFLVYASYAFTK